MRQVAKIVHQKDKVEKFPDLAYDYIKERILNLTYKPGQPVSEAEVAKALAISRTPVREALNRLANEGLIISTPNRGKVVYTLSLRDIKEIFDIKESLEGLAASRAAGNRTPEQMEDLTEAVALMEKAVSEDNVDLWLHADGQFHDVLFRAAYNERLGNIITNLNEQWHRLRLGFIVLEGRIRKSTDEHKLIAQYIEEQEEEQAKEAMTEHLRNVRTALLDLIKNLVIPYVGENL